MCNKVSSLLGTFFNSLFVFHFTFSLCLSSKRPGSFWVLSFLTYWTATSKTSIDQEVSRLDNCGTQMTSFEHASYMMGTQQNVLGLLFPLPL